MEFPKGERNSSEQLETNVEFGKSIAVNVKYLIRPLYAEGEKGEKFIWK